MNWPPPKAFTSTKSIHGYRHFVAINYGGKASNKWVSLVSVLDGDIRLKVFWNDLQKTKFWLCGWQKMSRDESNSPLTPTKKINIQSYKESTCLHSSIDSGIDIPFENNSLRNWF